MNQLNKEKVNVSINQSINYWIYLALSGSTADNNNLLNQLLLLHPYLDIKGTVNVFQVILYAKMAMQDSQRYPWKYFLIKYEIEIHMFNF